MDPLNSRLLSFIKKPVFWLFIIFLLSLPFINPWVRGDGVGYYAYVRSFFMDGDLDFRNEYSHGNRTFLDGTFSGMPPPTKTGHVPNQWSVGPAVLWTPFFLIGHSIAFLLNKLGWNVAVDGYSKPYLYAISIGTAIYGFIGLLLIFNIIRNYYRSSIAFVATVTIWLASSIPVYMYFNPSWSHSHALFAVSLFVWLWWKTRNERSLLQWGLLGLAAGLMAMIRLVDIVFIAIVLLPFVLTIWENRKTLTDVQNIKLISGFIIFIFCTFLAMTPYFIAKKIIYGSFLKSGYGLEFQFLSPVLLSVLFSSRHGLFSWTPVLLLGTIGMLWFYRKDKELAILLAIPFVLKLYIVSCWPVWWGSSSFGNRFFISCTPFFAIGFAALLNQVSQKISLKWISAVALLLILWNGLFIFQFGAGLIPRHDPISWRLMISNQFTVVPQKLVNHLSVYFSNRSKYQDKLEHSEFRLREQKSQ